MKKRTRNILVILSVLVVIFTTFIGYGIYSVYNFFNEFGDITETEIPNELKEAGIPTGNGFVKKTDFFKLDGGKLVKTIGKSSSITDKKKRSEYIDSQTARQFYGFDNIKVCGEEIVAVGKFGGFVFSKNGDVLREIIFEQKVEKVKILFFKRDYYRTTLDNLQIYDFEGDGKCEFVSNSSIDGVVVFDGDGRAIWRYGERDIDLNRIWKERTEKEKDEENWITGAFAVDLDSDGTGELIVTRKNDGIRAFDINRKELWFQPDKYPTADYEIFDYDGDGKNEILEFQGASSLLRNAQNGEKLKDLRLEYGLEEVIALRDKNGKKNFRFFRIEDNKIKVFDISNKIVWESAAPLSKVKKAAEKPEIKATPTQTGNFQVSVNDSYNNSEYVHRPKAVSVKLKADQPEYLAIIASFIQIPRSSFYIYDGSGKLVYHEILPENAETISVFTNAESRQEILVGGKSSIWKYGV